MFFLGVLMVFLWIAIVLLSRSITTFFHEMGHAIPALLFTKAPVTVYIGSYGNISKSLKINIGRLTIYFTFNFFAWKIGMCRHKSSGILINEIITILGGPLMSIVVSLFLIIYMAKNGASNAMASIFGVFILSAIWDFIVNIYPSKSPFYLHDGSFIYSDGYQLKRLLQESTFPEEYFNALKKYHEKKYADAAQDLKTILNNGFKKREIYRLLCECFDKEKNYTEAISYYEEYYSHFKFQTEDYAHLGSLFLKKGEYQQALTSLEQALHKDYANPRTINDKGMTLLELGNTELAIQEFTSAIHFQPKFADAYRNRGYAKMKINQLDEAYQDFQAALQKDASSPYNHLYLGKYFEKRWQYEEALMHYEKAKELGIDYHGIDFDIAEVKKRTM